MRQRGSTEALDYRRRYRGLIGISSKVPIRDRSVLAVVYTPGVAEPCLEIAKDPGLSFQLTCRGNTVALVTNGSALYGFPQSSPEAALPAMEGKSLIFKNFAGVDAFPVCLRTADPLSMVQMLSLLTPTFGAICLEDIAAPGCFTIADHLDKAAQIPVFNNHHHGAAIIVAAALMNALKVVGKSWEETRAVISGAGVAGIGVARLLSRMGMERVVVCDRAGAIHSQRPVRMNWAKWYLAKETNPAGLKGSLADCMVGADVFIGFSAGGLVTPAMVSSMARDPVVLALAVPEPEISGEEALEGGARVVATALSGHPNQLDIALAFPGVFRGLLDVGARSIRLGMLVEAARALARLVPPQDLEPDHIVPAIFDYRVAPAVAEAVCRAAIDRGEGRSDISPAEVGERTRHFVYHGQMPLPLRSPGPLSTAQEAMELRRRHNGVLQIEGKLAIKDHHILDLLCLPPDSVEPARRVLEEPSLVYDYTMKGNLVAIVTDGSAVLGLGDIGAQAALPVMEGKAVLFHTLAGVEAFPICIASKDPAEVVEVVKAISPTFGGVNLEDISAPRCFEIEERLRSELDIPVFHDDQHGTAIVVLASLKNALRLIEEELERVRIVISGAGAAGVAVSRLLLSAGARDVILCDRHGTLYVGRGEGMNPAKETIATATNPAGIRGSLAEALRGADVFVGVSGPGIVSEEMVASMSKNAIVFALANPIPEVMPENAKQAGARVVATGRSDYPNQVNNALAFPGVFRGALDCRARSVNETMEMAAAEAIAGLVSSSELKPDYIVPGAMDFRVPAAVAASVARAAMETGQARLAVDPDDVARHTTEFIYEGVLGPSAGAEAVSSSGTK